MRNKRRLRMKFRTIDLLYHLLFRRNFSHDELLEIHRNDKESLRRFNRQGYTFEDEEDRVINAFKIMGAKKITRKRPRRGRDYKNIFIY